MTLEDGLGWCIEPGWDEAAFGPDDYSKAQEVFQNETARMPELWRNLYCGSNEMRCRANGLFVQLVKRLDDGEEDGGPMRRYTYDDFLAEKALH